MTSFSFPDINVWLALLLADHVHRDSAKSWWAADQSSVIGFSRLTQLGVLRILTTAAAMNDRPLSNRQAWRAYEKLFEDTRVHLIPEPSDLDTVFRELSSVKSASPKLWADAYLAAFATACDATLVTFDQALARKSPNARLLS